MATKTAFYDPITAELRANNFDSAAAQIEAAKAKKKYGKKDRFVYYLDAGLAWHYAAKFDSSNIRLHDAEDAADELFTRSISRAAVSVLLNDNALEYAGEDYEILYSDLISALNYIAVNDVEGAFVEIKQANEKLDLLEQKYRNVSDKWNEGIRQDTTGVNINYEADKVRFNNDAFARYLSMRMYAANGKFDDARIDYGLLKRAFIEQPHIYDFPMPDVKYIPENGTILSIVGLCGLSPVKEALNLRLRTDKDLDLVQVLYTDPALKDTEYSHFPMKVSEDYYFKFAIPTLQNRLYYTDRIRVHINGDPVGELELLEDIGKVARETFAAKKSLIYLRTVARAVAKGLVAHKQKQKADNGKAGGWLAKLGIDILTDISENADLRCGRFLPDKIYVADIDIAPGSYDILIEFLTADGTVISTTEIHDYQVLKHGLNLIEAVSIN